MRIVTPEVKRSLPLPTLLSQPLVALTIECDNEFERQMSQWQAPPECLGERGLKPWCASLAMWCNFIRFLGDEAVPVRKLEYLARISNIAGLERWGYISVIPNPADARPKPPRADWLVRPTCAGRKAREVWEPLIADVEERWNLRYGVQTINILRKSLLALVKQLDPNLPEFLPVLRFGLFSSIPKHVSEPLGPAFNAGISSVQLLALLSNVLLSFTIDFERESDVSLAICANVIRVMGDDADATPGVLMRNLPRLSGVSKEAISMAAGWLVRNGYAVTGQYPAMPGVKSVRLKHKGVEVKAKYEVAIRAIEDRWKANYGELNVQNIRQSLEALYQSSDECAPTLSAGLHPYPDGWRARKPYVTQTNAVIRDPAGNLPHFPMVLHRGGYPDGS